VAKCHRQAAFLATHNRRRGTFLRSTSPIETFSLAGYPMGMRRLARAFPLPVAVAMVVCAMALAAAAQGTARQNHLPAGKSTYLDSAQRQRVDWYPWGKEAHGAMPGDRRRQNVTRIVIQLPRSLPPGNYRTRATTRSRVSAVRRAST
jgi:hypothetical protein